MRAKEIFEVARDTEMHNVLHKEGNVRKLKMLFLPLALAGMIIGFVPSASATSTGVVAFQGHASTSSLGLPVVHAQSGTWSFQSDVACQEATVNVGKKSNPQAGPCSIDGSGTFTGIVDEYTSQGNTVGAACGHSVGKGTGTITDSAGQTIDWTITPHWVSAGSVLLIPGTVSKTSTSQSGNFVSVVNAIADPNSSGSCLSKTAQSFLVTGVSAYELR